MFSSLFGRKGQTRLYTMFQYLNDIEKGLAQRIERYVLSGEDPVVVDRVAALSDSKKVYAGLYLLGYHQQNRLEPGASRQKEIRATIGDLVFEPFMQDDEALRRFGMLLHGLYSYYDAKPYYCEVPTWLKSLVDILNLSCVESNDKNGWLMHCSPEWFEAKLAANDIERNVIFGIVLERVSYSSGGVLANTYCKAIDWSQVILKPEFLSILDSIHLSGRLKLVALLSEGVDLNQHLLLLIHLTTSSSKELRKAAQRLLPSVNTQAFAELALARFSTMPVTQRKELAALLLLLGDEGVATRLQAITENDKSKSVRDAVAKALADKCASASMSVRLDVPSYKTLPAPAPLSKAFEDMLQQQFSHAAEKARIAAAEEEVLNKQSGSSRSWKKQQYLALKKQAANIKPVMEYIRCGNGNFEWAVMQQLDVDKVLQHPEFQIAHVINTLEPRRIDLRGGNLSKWLSAHPENQFDLRQFTPLLRKIENPKRFIASWYLEARWGSENVLPATENVLFWPFFAQNSEFLDEAFELRPSTSLSYRGFDKIQAMLVLRAFPVIPERYLQLLYSLALSPSKTHGLAARETLQTYGLVPARIIEALGSSKQDERIVAANWIHHLVLKDAIPMVQKALTKERSETAKAALLSCLSALGEPIDEYLAPKALQAEATKGLKKAMPKSIAWFPFEDMPALTWNTGEIVQASIVQWWLALAAKLKQPEGNPLFNLYLAQLSNNSKQVLSSFILEQFIKQDTRNPSDEEAEKYAALHQQQRLAMYQRWAQGDSEWAQRYKNKTLQDVYVELVNEHKSVYLGSAIGAKGILCFAGFGSGADLVQIISAYMKQHYTRRHHIEAMLASLAQSNDPAAIQLLLSVARRYRTRSVQDKAKALIEIVAERNGWSQDELADRTIPSAGFELSGTQVIELGNRPITIRLSDQFKPIIENQEGRVLKAFPAARKDDDEAKVKDAKKQFSTLKKELKQVVELQTARLYESMCLGREWPFQEWQDYLFNHPIVTHLTQRLVWLVQQGDEIITIRPTAERELIDIDDEEFEASEGATIKIAHMSDLSEEQAKQWQQLIKEEKLKQPFDQFSKPRHALTAAQLKADRVNYHQGWVADTFVVRNVMTKLGYKRGEAEDGGFFGNYFKEFNSLNLCAVLEFSGNCLPEEQLPAVIYHIAFMKADKRYGWSNETNYLPLADLPKTLVMEVMRDYETLAAKAAYDEDWQRKNPW